MDTWHNVSHVSKILKKGNKMIKKKEKRKRKGEKEKESRKRIVRSVMEEKREREKGEKKKIFSLFFKI